MILSLASEPSALRSPLPPLRAAQSGTLLGDDADLASLASYDESAIPTTLPGDVAFESFEWFGISGTNVTLTSRIPSSVTTLYLVHHSILTAFPKPSE